MQQQMPENLIKSILFISLISLWLLWLWSRRALYRFALNFPGNFGLPIIGSFYVIKDMKEIIQGVGFLFDRCKSNTICIWLGLRPSIATTDPEFIEKVLSSNELLNKGKSTYNPIYQGFQGGIIASPEPAWRHSRKVINPAFKHKVLASFLPVFHKGKNAFLAQLDKMVDNGEHKLCDMISRWSLGITVETTMGLVSGPGDEAIAGMISDLRYALKNVVFHIMLTCLNIGPLFMLHFKFKRHMDGIYKFVLKLIKEKLKILNNQTTLETKVIEKNSAESIAKTPKIFIDQAIETYQRQEMSLNDIAVESNNIVLASFETTANGMYSALSFLAMHPNVQERLFEEIVDLFPEKDFEMELEHLEQLPYLSMVIDETLRLAPSIPIIARQAIEDTAISDDLVLPKGIEIAISIFHLHRRKDIWGPNANLFDPDNFLPQNIIGRHPYAYMPFSKGIRNCVGWRYAMFAMKVMLAGLVRNYRFTTSAKYEDVDFAWHIVLQHLNEPSFVIHRRD